MIKVICNSKSIHTQRTGPHESSTTYQATFIVRSEGQLEIDSKFDIILTESEYDRYDVGKTYTFGP